MTGWSLQNVSNVAAWVALGVGVLTAVAFVITSGIVFSREGRRYERLNNRTRSLQNELDLCYCDTFFFDDIFTILNVADPSKTFQFSAGNISVGTNRTYTMPNRNGTVALLDDIPPPVTTFADDAFAVFNVIDITKIIMFDASILNTTRVYTWPNKDGTVALLADIPVITSVFDDDVFAVQNAVDPSKEIMFDVSVISAATTRTYIWPNKDGTVAMLSDIIALLTNTSEFLDSAFAILNDPDVTKIATFDASLIGTATTRSYFFPDISGTLALTAGTQTLSDKTLDNSNTITVLDMLFDIQDNGDNTRVATFDAALISTATTRVYDFPDLSGVLLLTSGVQTVSDKTLANSNTIFVLDTQLDIQDNGDNTKVAVFDASAITTATTRTYSFQDQDCTLACLSDVSGTFLDSVFTIENDPDTTKKAMFDASAIATSTTRTYTFPDADGTLALDFVSDGFYAERTSVQAITTSSITTVIFDDDTAGLGNDPGDNYDNSTGTYTAPADGFYDISFYLEWTVDNSKSFFQGRILITSSSRATSFIRLADGKLSDGTVLTQTTNEGTMLHADLRSGDTIIVEAFQDTGGNHNLSADSLFSVVRTG